MRITRILLAVICTALFTIPSSGMDFDKANPAYAKGANDALDAITLLDLELKLSGERKTLGEMADIVRSRLIVPKPDDGVIQLDAPPSNPVKGQRYRIGRDPNIRTYLGGGAWNSTLLYWSEQ